MYSFIYFDRFIFHISNYIYPIINFFFNFDLIIYDSYHLHIVSLNLNLANHNLIDNPIVLIFNYYSYLESINNLFNSVHIH